MTLLKTIVLLLIEKKIGKSVSQKNLNGPPKRLLVRFYIPDIRISYASLLAYLCKNVELI